ncbi:hypothetical protein QQP08_012088 [Theobroma cacao]|nr:hypothetical protein QQP08_012088 [Theobroma cacao]
MLRNRGTKKELEENREKISLQNYKRQLLFFTRLNGRSSQNPAINSIKMLTHFYCQESGL